MGAAWRVRNAVNSIRMERVRRPKTRRQGSGQTLGVYSPNALSRRQDGEEGVVALRTALDWPGRQTLRWFLVTSEALPRTRSE
jgi:hypothetical protein